MDWESASASDPGRVRQNNEDSLLVRDDPGLFAVADGMGGHAAGEVASGLAIDMLAAVAARPGSGLEAASLADVFEKANRALLDRARAEPATRGMGTTLSVLADVGAGEDVLVAHIGDSRIYRWRDGRLDQVTRDHTWVQEHVDAGVLDRERARTHPFSSVLTRVLGTMASAAPDIDRVVVEPGDTFLLCSDGLSGMLEDDELAAVLAADSSLADKVLALVHAANQRGGTDNITVILARASRSA